MVSRTAPRAAPLRPATHATRELASLFDALGDPVAVFDPDLHVRFANPAFARLAGRAAVDCTGRRAGQLGFDGTSCAALEAAVLRVLNLGTNEAAELRTDAAGARAVLAQLWPIRGPRGRVTGAMAFARAAGAPAGGPAAADDRLEQALQASGLGLWELDLDSGQFHIDERFAHNVGYRPEQLRTHWDSAVAMVHPDDAIPVTRRLEAHLRGETAHWEFEARMLTAERDWTWIAARGRAIRDAAGTPTRMSGTLKNIDAEHRVREQLALAAQQLQHQALHDPLTGLLNRRGFSQKLDELLASARDAARVHALCYLDLDHFKVVNDTCGHAAGDELLRQLPGLLQPTLPERGVLARLGGDEFAVLLEDCTLEQATAVAQRLRDVIRGFRFAWQYRRFTIGVSMGVVGIDAASGTAATVLGAADAACYVAKDKGPNHVHVSPPHDLAIVRRRGEMRWVAQLKAALEDDHFRLHCQSIAPLSGGAPPQHHELLLRLDAQGELIYPGVFLPAAERFQLMPQIDQWVIDRALQMLGAAPAGALAGHRFGINLSGESLRDAHLLGFIADALARHRVPGAALYFELTETAAVANLGTAAEFMRGLRSLGCELALDDFGNGMSSFAYLKHLPVDYLKIDGGFVRELPTNPVDQAIVRAVQAVGRQLGIKTVAEYVESEAIKASLRAIGVGYGQGYAIAYPIALEDFPLLRPTLVASA